MKHWKTFGGSLAFISLMGSTAAFADITAQQVWDDWQRYLTSSGYQLTSNDTADYGTVTVNDLTMSMSLPDDGRIITIAMGPISFAETGEGSVTVEMGHNGNMPIAVSMSDAFAATLNYSDTDMSMIVSGSVDKMVYDYSAAKQAISLVDLTIEGVKIPDAVLDLVLKNVIGNTISTAGDLRDMVQSLTVGTIDYKFSLTEPDKDFAINLKGTMSDVVANAQTSMPKGMDFNQMAKALTSGYATRVKFGWGSGGYEFDSSDKTGTMKGSSASESGSLNFAMDRDQLQFDGVSKGIKASVSGTAIALPSIGYEMAEAVFAMQMPINKSQTPADYALTIRLADLTVDDDIWAMFDPMSVLPRAPATLDLAFDGKANWLIDIMDAQSDAAKNIAVPGQLHALTLKTLQLKIAGADLTGSGDFTFDNDDLTTFNGMPAPTGELNLKLVGGNGLLDNLIKMGMVPQDQAMGVRMMMGLFAVAADGDDTLTSKLEVKGDGSVYANGQRLK